MSAIVRIEAGPRMSRAVVYGGILYTSGQVDAKARDVAGQMRNILAAIDRILENAGTSRSKLISANVWLADISMFDEMNAVWDGWIDSAAPPARATVESRLADPRFRVEVAIVAAV